MSEGNPDEFDCRHDFDAWCLMWPGYGSHRCLLPMGHNGDHRCGYCVLNFSDANLSNDAREHSARDREWVQARYRKARGR